MLLQQIQSYIQDEQRSTESFNEYYMKYMMSVQDSQLDKEMSKLFSYNSFEKLIEIDREVNKLQNTFAEEMQ